jgi:hypothetical protein
MSDIANDRGIAAVEAALRSAPRLVRERNGAPAPAPASTPADYAQPEHRPDTVTKALGPLPPYVTHAPNVSRSAAIAAHAVVVDYEKAAQTVEAMGLDYHKQAQAVIRKVIDTAQLIRDRGAEAFREVEMSSKIGDEVVSSLNDLKAKMGLQDRIVDALAEPAITSEADTSSRE